MILGKETGGEVSESRNRRSTYFPEHEKEIYDASAIKEIHENQKKISDLEERMNAVAKHQFSEHLRINEIEARYRARTPELVRKETIECVVDKIEEEWAFVVVVVDGHEEERMMSKALLAGAGVLHEGQPFQIEVTETKTSEGLDSLRRIRCVGDPSREHLQCVRPNLDLGKFRKKTEKDQCSE